MSLGLATSFVQFKETDNNEFVIQPKAKNDDAYLVNVRLTDLNVRPMSRDYSFYMIGFSKKTDVAD